MISCPCAKWYLCQRMVSLHMYDCHTHLQVQAQAEAPARVQAHTPVWNCLCQLAYQPSVSWEHHFGMKCTNMLANNFDAVSLLTSYAALLSSSCRARFACKARNSLSAVSLVSCAAAAVASATRVCQACSEAFRADSAAACSDSSSWLREVSLDSRASIWSSASESLLSAPLRLDSSTVGSDKRQEEEGW